MTLRQHKVHIKSEISWGILKMNASFYNNEY